MGRPGSCLRVLHHFHEDFLVCLLTALARQFHSFSDLAYSFQHFFVRPLILERQRIFGFRIFGFRIFGFRIFGFRIFWFTKDRFKTINRDAK